MKRSTYLKQPQPPLESFRGKPGKEMTMTNQSAAHQGIAWSKQKLDDIDAMLAQMEKSAVTLKGNARQAADKARSRIEAARHKLHARTEKLRSEAGDVKDAVLDVQSDFEDEWIEVETAFQSYLVAVADRADAVRDALAARAKAQRKSWQDGLNEIRTSAEAAVAAGLDDVDAAIRRASEEAEKLQKKAGQIPSVGEESWKAIRDGLDEARAVHDRTVKKIGTALARLF